MMIPAGKRTLLLAALTLPLLMAGCATRSSVETAQNAANAADAHAGDARQRADAAHARADEAAGIGNSALAAAQSDAERVTILEGQLQKANTKLSYLQRNVVFKKVAHKKHVRHHHAVKHTASGDQSGS